MTLYKPRQSKYWYRRFVFKGRIYVKSTRQTSKVLAREFETQYKHLTKRALTVLTTRYHGRGKSERVFTSISYHTATLNCAAIYPWPAGNKRVTGPYAVMYYQSAFKKVLTALKKATSKASKCPVNTALIAD